MFNKFLFFAAMLLTANYAQASNVKVCNSCFNTIDLLTEAKNQFNITGLSDWTIISEPTSLIKTYQCSSTALDFGTSIPGIDIPLADSVVECTAVALDQEIAEAFDLLLDIKATLKSTIIEIPSTVIPSAYGVINDLNQQNRVANFALDQLNLVEVASAHIFSLAKFAGQFSADFIILTVVFSDNSTIDVMITNIGTEKAEIDRHSAIDGDGNVILPHADAYTSSMGGPGIAYTAEGTEGNIQALRDYLQGINALGGGLTSGGDCQTDCTMKEVEQDRFVLSCRVICP